jgi:hypothetical protein
MPVSFARGKVCKYKHPVPAADAGSGAPLRPASMTGRGSWWLLQVKVVVALEEP